MHTCVYWLSQSWVVALQNTIVKFFKMRSARVAWLLKSCCTSCKHFTCNNQIYGLYNILRFLSSPENGTLSASENVEKVFFFFSGIINCLVYSNWKQWYNCESETWSVHPPKYHIHFQLANHTLTQSIAWCMICSLTTAKKWDQSFIKMNQS